MTRINQKIISYLHSLPSPIIIVDVGCNLGWWKDEVTQSISKPSFWVGIDPLRLIDPDSHVEVPSKYDLFIQKAIFTQETTKPFYRYYEAGLSSFLPMNEVSYDPQDAEKKFYSSWVFDAKLQEIISVPVIPLRQIIDENPKLSTIHFLKIDTQGVDIQAVDSLENHIKNVHFIQLECNVHPSKITLYPGQSHYLDDIRHMAELGFFPVEPEKIIEQTLTPEIDIIFYNKLINFPVWEILQISS